MILTWKVGDHFIVRPVWLAEKGIESTEIRKQNQKKTRSIYILDDNKWDGFQYKC